MLKLPSLFLNTIKHSQLQTQTMRFIPPELQPPQLRQPHKIDTLSFTKSNASSAATQPLLHFGVPSWNEMTTPQQLISLIKKPIFSDENMTLIKSIIETTPEMIRLRENGTTLLHMAVKSGHQKIAEYLIEKDPHLLDIKDRDEETVFHKAASNGHIVLFEFLWEKKSNLLGKKYNLLEERDNQGNPVLHRAALNGQVEMVKYLLDKALELVKEKNGEGKTAAEMVAKRMEERFTQAALTTPKDTGYAQIVQSLGDGKRRQTLKEAQEKAQAEETKQASTLIPAGLLEEDMSSPRYGGSAPSIDRYANTSYGRMLANTPPYAGQLIPTDPQQVGFPHQRPTYSQQGTERSVVSHPGSQSKSDQGPRKGERRGGARGISRGGYPS